MVAMVRRIYVEKKIDFAVEARGLLSDLRQNLKMEALTGLRLLNRYDIENVDDVTYQESLQGVFAEAGVDLLFEETLPKDISQHLFVVEYLPGQYDQRADSAEQCIKLLNPSVLPSVRCGKVIAPEGKLSQEELYQIKTYLINPVDSREAASTKPNTLAMEVTAPEDVPIIRGFCSMTEEELESYRMESEFAMSKADLFHVADYFRNEEQRDPTLTELKVLDTYWSDHCRHTTFNTKLSDIYFETSPYGEVVRQAFEEYIEMRREVYGDKKKDVTLMDVACLGAKYLKKLGKVEDLDESEEINACSIRVTADIDGQYEEWIVQFKNETHNHPTEIEPFGGAATCLGGAIRDPLSGRAYVYQAMRVTGAADPRKPVSETLKGKLPQKKLTREAAAGYSSYGNQIGLAAGQIDEVYHEDYVAKRMELGAVIGASPASHVVRLTPEPGDVILLVGGRTGRDGCGGATGSSKEHTEGSLASCGAEVQKGNPPVERNIQRLFRRKEAATLIKRCNDFGAGGVSVAIGELADGLLINLDTIPKKYEGLNGTELAISESQERMAVVVSPKDEDLFLKYAAEENLEAKRVALVNDSGRVKMTWQGTTILDLSRNFINTNGAGQAATASVKSPAGYGDAPVWIPAEDYLSDLNCCSKKGLIERFDSTIGAATVLMPLGGKYQRTPAPGMAAKLPLTVGYDGHCPETDTATLMAYGYDPYLAKESPFHGALNAVMDSVTKIVAMGGDRRNIRLSFQEYFEKLSGDEAWGKPLAALLGALKVQKALEIPAIGGKDSMSGTFMDLNVPPALISFAMTTAKASQIISPEIKKVGSKLVVLSVNKDGKGIPDFEAFKKSMDQVYKLVTEGRILSANPIGRGGIFISLVKMAVGNKIGASLYSMSLRELTEASYGSLLLEISKKEDISALMNEVPYKVIGETTDQASIMYVIDGQQKKISLNEVLKRWTAPLEEVFPTKTDDSKTVELQSGELKIEELKAESVPDGGATIPSVDCLSKKSKVYDGPMLKTPKPKVLIPAFPGTNCEMDSLRAFTRAGGDGEILIIRNLTQEALVESIATLAKKIKESQIIMLPGGFSGGDEPDGSAKFITAVFRNPGVAEAVTDLLENRDGLILGVCNGFQALIKLGLVPFGRIVPQTEENPTLTFNKIGRHMSCLVRTRVASTLSPWLSACSVGDVHTIAVSHGEGRFVSGALALDEMIARGQIATQYVDYDGNPSMDIRYNPNDSLLAVEGITSPDGRVYGKMAHSERMGINVYKNVPGNFDQKLFESGVGYFK
jgi:phosphoribosylformylglycinamidine synthase